MDSGSSKKACDVAGSSVKFPVGLRVLVVDDDPTCLKILDKMLRLCLYEVITCSRAKEALDVLRERKNMFDLVISDVHMPDMDGFKLLEQIGLEMDLPVIMMSVDDKKEVVMKGVTHGACDYLIKPVRIEAIRNIWQHVVRKRRMELKELEQAGSYEDNERNHRVEDAEYTSSANEGSWKSSKKRKEEEDDGDDRDDTSTLKKPRVVWSVELHQQFVAAVNQLGIDKAVPKKILELMNVPGLTRENVASHLQKYRLYLRRISSTPNTNGINLPFMCSPEANYGTASSFDGLDLQGLAVSGQLQPNTFATIQAGGLGRSSVNTGIGNPHLDQRNPYNSEVARLRFGGTQASDGVTGFVSLPSLSNHNSSVHGMMPLAQSRPTGQLLNDSTGTPLSIGQQIFPNELGGHMLGGRNMTVLNGRATPFGPSSSHAPFGPSSSHAPFGSSSSQASFGPSSSQASSMLDFQRMNNSLQLPGNSFPMGIPPTGVSTLQPKGPRGYHPTNYNIFSEHPQNVDITFEASQHPRPLNSSNNINFTSPVMAHQGLLTSSTQRNDGSISSNSLLLGEGTQFVPSESLSQQNSFRVKAESMGDVNADNMYLGKQFDQGDLMSAILKQPGGGQGENDFNFDGYSLDDISV